MGGGIDGVKAIAQDAKRSGLRNVFAVVDRDLRKSNRIDWFSPGKTFSEFVPPVHEVENHLLDPAALAACPYNNRCKTRDEIEGFLLSRARNLCWWVACLETVAELKSRFRDECIRNPRYPTVNDLDPAVNHVLSDNWFQKLDRETARSTAADVRQLVLDNHAKATQRLNDGSWRDEFAGKEILNHVGSQIVDWQKTARKGPTADSLPDLAKEVADWQVKNQTVRQDLLDLRLALKERIKRPS